ncbi:hypothetical protein AAXE64_08080 [Priestia megaterium]
MSKIQESLDVLKGYNATTSVDSIVENSSIKDIKEYITYLQNEVEKKDKEIYKLARKNATLEVRLEI